MLKVALDDTTTTEQAPKRQSQAIYNNKNNSLDCLELLTLALSYFCPSLNSVDETVEIA